MTTTYVYDGSWLGVLTAIFDVFSHKSQDPRIAKASVYEPTIFGETQEVITCPDKAGRVLRKIQTQGTGKARGLMYRAFLSEEPGIEGLLLQYTQLLLKNPEAALHDFGHPVTLAIHQAMKKVGREKHRMEAFIRFHLLDEHLYAATIEPDFNVLPVIAPHFKGRYADQIWMIYDIKRKYGIYYNLHTVVEITLDATAQPTALVNSTTVNNVPEIENNYCDLWNEYFKKTNITSRKNMKLHVQHVPKRYWKYLSEKV